MTEDPSEPDFATLLDWVEGRLSTDAAANVARQVSVCGARTQATVHWLRSLSAQAPPAIVRQNLQQHFRRWALARAAEQRAPIGLTATLLFDSRQGLATLGTRHRGATFHLAFTTSEADLIIDVRRRRDHHVRLDGQVLLVRPTDAPVFRATTVQSPDHTVGMLDGDDLGRFTVTGVPAERCRLQLTNGEIVISADLDLTAGRKR